MEHGFNKFTCIQFITLKWNIKYGAEQRIGIAEGNGRKHITMESGTVNSKFRDFATSRIRAESA